MSVSIEQRQQACPPEAVRHYLKMVAVKHPLVQCITNIVTVNDCANALLAVGASPTMAHHPQEMEDFAAFCHSLVLNMGATESLEAMLRAGMLAHEKGHPIILDPVGCAGSRFRREKCLELIDAVHPSCIRGNASEICALAERTNTGQGVDEPVRDSFTIGGLARTASALSQETGAIIIATGRIDLLASGKEIREIHAGSELMSRITGSGCMLSALLGGFLAAECSLDSAWACCTWMARCGEEAEKKVVAADGGTGSFHMYLLDALGKDTMTGFFARER